MKKTLTAVISILLIAVFLASAVLAVNLELNIKIRRKLSTLIRPFEIVTAVPKQILLTETGPIIDEQSKELMSIYETQGKVFLNVVHLNFDAVSSHYDRKNKVLSIIAGEEHLTVTESGVSTLNGEKIDINVALINLGESIYISLDDLNRISIGDKIGFSQVNGSQDGNVIIMNAYWPINEVTLNDGTWIFETHDALLERQKNDYEIDFLYRIGNLFNKTRILDESKRISVVAYDLGDDTLFIVDQSNTAGYVAKTDNMVLNTRPPEKTQLPNARHLSFSDPIVMTWEAVYSYNPDPKVLPEMPYVNVVSPTWYELADASGNITGKPSDDYIAWATGKSFHLWPLVSNAFDIDRTHDFLHDFFARKQFIEKLIEEAVLKGYEGINIDFENVYLEDRDALTHFVNEFVYYAHQKDLMVSMDVTVMGGSDNWSKCYDHPRLGKIVDFLVIMAYDEYWASSPVSGPVASYDWVEKHMTALAEVVDSRKLVLGIPLYTRVWREYPAEDVANKERVKSTAIGMEAQNTLIEKYALKPIWDEVDRLFYATFFENDAQVKIWIENAVTIKEKAKLVDTLNLKGVATWRRGFETPDIWPVFKLLFD